MKLIALKRGGVAPVICLMCWLFAIACGESDEPSVAVNVPKVGTIFRFSVAALDEKGARVRRDSTRGDAVDATDSMDSIDAPRWTSADTTATITVARTGVRFAGRENVTLFVQGDGGLGDTTYVSYEENGDLALTMPNPFGGRRWIWATFPFSGRSTNDTLLQLDTTIHEMPVHVELVSSYGGQEKMTVAGKLVDVRRGNVSFRVFYQTTAGRMEGGIEQIIWFSPAIGFLVRKEERGIGVDALGAEQGMVMRLEGVGGAAADTSFRGALGK